MSLPPELRLLCRRLTSTAPEELPRVCPTLVAYVLRCGAALSAPSSDRKTKSMPSSSSSSEAPMLVHKLKTNINTLLSGKSSSGRFAAVSLIKAIIDVGGWECLRTSDLWVRGLISVIQKPADPLPAKELCIVTLTRIYTLLRPFQTLVREMATPTLPSFVTACLQLVKPSAPGRPPLNLKLPASLIQAVACSLSKIVTLYPTTLRPFTSQVRASYRGYIAPTLSDRLCVPRALRQASHRLWVLLSYTAPKDGSSEEWAKGFVHDVHASHLTSNHILRAVHETWESADAGPKASCADQDPCGGSDDPQDFPPWTGVAAGAERLVGLLDLLAEHFRAPTKAPVAIPLGQLMQLTSRLALVTPPSPPNYEEPAQMLNPGISRDERAEVWAALPNIHRAVLRLHLAVVRRLGASSTPLAADMIDQAVRVFIGGRHVLEMREAAYALLRELLLLVGPTLARITVDSMNGIAQDCCRDLLQAAGHLENRNNTSTLITSRSTTKGGSTAKPTALANSINADAFLAPQPADARTTTAPSAAPHLQAAEALLVVLFSHVPQVHLSPETRGLLDRTAILCDSRDAMLVSCLYPYRSSSSGRYYPSILPFLARRFPRDQGVELLRTNLRAAAAAGPGEGNAVMYRTGHVRDDDELWTDDNNRNLAKVRDESSGRDAAGGAQQTEMDDTSGGLGLDPGMDTALFSSIADAVDGQEPAVESVGADTAFGKGPVDLPASDNPFTAMVAKQIPVEGLRADLLAEDHAKRASSPLKRKGSNVESSTVKKRVDAAKESRRDEAEEPRATAVTPSDPPPMRKDSSAAPVASDGDEAHDSDDGSEGSVQINMDFDDDEEEDDEEDE